MSSKYIILDLTNSPKENKRFRITYSDDMKVKHTDFGLKGGDTFIDHHNLKKRENYRKRHLANKTERNRIENLIPSPALFSYKLLWGDSPDLLENIIELQKEWNAEYPIG
jgi:hypothetical protein